MRSLGQNKDAPILKLKNMLKALPSYFLSAIISIIVLGLIGGPILYYCEGIRLHAKNILMLPTPLWITIGLCMGIYLYFYIQNRRNHSYDKKKIENNNSKTKSKEQKLDIPAEQVLLTFFDEATELSVLHFERLCIFQGINGAQYYLDELLRHDYIRKYSGDHDPNITYIISSKGRKYVMENIQNRT